MIAATSALSLLAPWPLAIIVDSVLGSKPLPHLVPHVARGPRHRTQLLSLLVVAGLAHHRLEHAHHRRSTSTSTRGSTRGWCSTCAATCSAHVAAAVARASTTARSTGTADVRRSTTRRRPSAPITVAIPPLLQSVVTLVGMFFDRRTGSSRRWRSLSLTRRARSSTLARLLRAPRSSRASCDVRRLEGQSLSIVHEAMSMLRVIVAFGRERYEWRRFRAQGETAVDARAST